MRTSTIYFGIALLMACLLVLAILSGQAGNQTAANGVFGATFGLLGAAALGIMFRSMGE